VGDLGPLLHGGSFGIEAVQALVLPARSAQFVDVVSNTLGALVGALLAVPLAGRVYAERRTSR
jgi:VanZ family protein